MVAGSFPILEVISKFNIFKNIKKNTVPRVGPGSKPSVARAPERGTSSKYAPS